MVSKVVKQALNAKDYKQRYNLYKKLNVSQKLEYDLKKDKMDRKAIKNAVRSNGYRHKKFDKVVQDVLGKYDPQETFIKNLKFNGSNIISLRINADPYQGQKFTTKTVQKLSDKLSRELLANGFDGKQATAMIYGDYGWKAGYFNGIGDDAELYDINKKYENKEELPEPDSIPAFNIYINLKRRIGGNSDSNDCLYYSLKFFIYNLDSIWKSAEDLKKFLGLNRTAKIPLSKIDMIEKKLKDYQINVIGDFTRTSTVKSNRIINLKLVNEHYEPVKHIKKNLCPTIRFQEKKPLMFNRKTMESYDGESVKTLTHEEMLDILFDYSNEYILVDMTKRKKSQLKPIEEEYRIWKESADILKEKTKGKINMYKTGNYKNTALDLFDRMTKFLEEPEALLQDEAEWIENAKYSSLIFAEKYSGELYHYDVKSLFPYLMMSNNLKVPIKRGEFMILDKLDEILQFGIYRCVISQSEDSNMNKLFRYNKSNYYCTQDIQLARELNLKVELIQDNKPNFLYYSGDKTIKSCVVFSEYVKILFDLKEQKIEGAKMILNILWGALGQIVKDKVYTKCQNFECDESEDFLNEIQPNPFDDREHIIKTRKIINFYKTTYARYLPFLLSRSRKFMSDIMLPHIEHIYRCNVDGFYIDKSLHSNTNVNIGELKFEKSGFGNIVNCTNEVF
jgi:hypothetical protein